MDKLTTFERSLRFLGVSKLRRGATLRYLRFPTDFSDEDVKFHRKVEKYTMTRPERIYALRRAVHYLSSSGIDGPFVECGVWRGGSAMAMANALAEVGEQRDIFLFDTFEGMPAPTEEDRSVTGESALETFARKKTGMNSSSWAYASVDEVRENVLSTGFNPNSFHLVKGKVEDTIPAHAPPEISLLRLDTDFYESTKHELVHLYDRVVPGGIIILDDYGHWRGAKQAVDEFLSTLERPPFLSRVDFAGRLIVKPGAL